MNNNLSNWRLMPIPNVITIDGPAASGKSTLGKKLADELGYLFFDTGVMYRAVTWAALVSGIDIEDESAVSLLAKTVEIDIQPASAPDGRTCDILMDGKDVTWEIRQPEVELNVSQVSAYPAVREALTDQQRRIGGRGRVVMVGRDIGTVVMPKAELKIYLVATAEERARRRFLEQIERGGEESYHDILSALHKRDQIDTTREFSPLRPAEDAIILDTDLLDVQQVETQARALVLRE